MENNSRSESRLQTFIDNPSKALWSLAIPIMFGMGIQTFYYLVDMMFIGRLGVNAIAGVAFNVPIFFLMLGEQLKVLCHNHSTNQKNMLL